MSNAAIARRGISASWLVPASLLSIVLLGAASSWVEPWVVPLSSQQKALLLERFAEGSILDYAIGSLHGLAWIGIVILLRPMVLLGLLILIESLLAPQERGNKKRALAWTVRGLFLIASYLIGLLLSRSATFLPSPLFDFADGAAASPLRTAQMALLLVLSMLVIDFFQYWSHRAFHRFPLLWRFHSVHHVPRGLDVLHEFQHPVEALISWFLVALPVSVLITGVDTNQLDLLAAFFAVQSHFVHMNAPVHLGPLGRVLVDNRYHFLHHGRDPRHFNCNFAAVFPVLDMAFGTYRPPVGDDLPETGLNDRLPPTRLRDYFLADLPKPE